MEAQDLIRELAQRLQLPQLELNAQRVCQIILEGEIAVDLEAPEGEDALYLAATIGRVPPTANRELLLGDLLAADLAALAAGNAVHGLDRNRDELLLCLRLDVDTLDGERLAARLMAFADELRQWQGWLEQAALDESGSAAEPGADATPEMVIIRG